MELIITDTSNIGAFIDTLLSSGYVVHARQGVHKIEEKFTTKIISDVVFITIENLTPDS